MFRTLSGPDGYSEVPIEPTLRPQGHLAYWETTHPFNREDHIDPLLMFRLAERKMLAGGAEAPGTDAGWPLLGGV